MEGTREREREERIGIGRMRYLPRRGETRRGERSGINKEEIEGGRRAGGSKAATYRRQREEEERASGGKLSN